MLLIALSLIAVAEKLYTAVEHRCDLANRKGSSGNTIIEMDDEEVLRCLRQNLV